MSQNFNLLNDIDSSDENNLINIFNNIIESGYYHYSIDENKSKDSRNEFQALSIAEQKKILLSMLDKNNLYVNYSDIEDKDYSVNPKDIVLNNNFYNL